MYGDSPSVSHVRQWVKACEKGNMSSRVTLFARGGSVLLLALGLLYTRDQLWRDQDSHESIPPVMLSAQARNGLSDFGGAVVAAKQEILIIQVRARVCIPDV